MRPDQPLIHPASMLRTVLITLSLLVGSTVATALGAYLNRVPLARWLIGQAAEQIGLRGTQLTVARLEGDHARLIDIRLGPDLRADRIDLSYSWRRLLHGQIDRVHVTGADVTISPPDQGALGLLRQRFLSDTGQHTPTAPAALPHVTVTDMILRGTLENTTVDLKLNADLAPDLSGTLTAIGRATRITEGRPIRLDGIRLNARLGRGLSPVSWRFQPVHISDGSVQPAFTDLQVSGDGVYNGTVSSFNLAISDQQKRLSAALTGDLDIVGPSIRANVTLSEVAFSPGHLQPDDLSPLVRLPVPVSGTLTGTAALTWRPDRPHLTFDVRLNGGGTEVENLSVSGVQARLVGIWPTTRDRIGLSVHVPHAILRRADQTVRLTSLAATVRIDPQTGNAAIRLPVLKLLPVSQPPAFHPLRLSGTGSLADRYLDFDLSVFLDQHAGLQKILTIVSRQQVSGESGYARLGTPVFALRPAGLQPGDILPSLTLLKDVDGQVAGQAELRWSAAGLDTSGSVQLTDLSVRTDTLLISGINSHLLFSSLLPLRTETSQTIRAAKISAAVDLNNPRLDFSISGTAPHAVPILTVNNLSANVIGGRIAVHNMQADPQASSHRFTLELQDLDLAEAFALVGLEGVSGSGKLSGQIPLVIADGDIAIDNGQLAGNTPGVLRFRSAQAKQALAGGGKQVDLLLRVLDDFRYNRLTLTVGRVRSGNARLGLHIGGHNPAVMNGQLFNLNINLEGNPDRLFKTLLEGYRLSDRAIRATVGHE